MTAPDRPEPDCMTLGCQNPGTVTGMYDDADEQHRVTYCDLCANAVADWFTPDRPEPGDTDRQTSGTIARNLTGVQYPGDRTIAAHRIAAALADAREQGYRAGKAEGEALRTAVAAVADGQQQSSERWTAAIQEADNDTDRGYFSGRAHAAEQAELLLRAVLDQHGGQR